MSTITSSPTGAPARSGDPGAAQGSRRSPHIGGLDGLRAIAVALVLVYHFFPHALPGGFLGVDVFFVISGFLITSLLLEERRRSGRIDLVSFWRRRARRLLPALTLALLVCTSLALLNGNRDLLVNIKAQLLGAIAFVSNWVFVVLGSDYFTRDNPELYRNTWSLSIEEQFYLVLPLLLVLTLRSRSKLTRSLLFILLSVGSAALMIALAAQGADASRVYFGSDTHVFGLFAGVSLAVLLQRVAGSAGDGAGEARPARFGGVGVQLGLILTALAGLGVLGWLSATLTEESPESFAWGFQLASAASLLVVWAVTREGAWAGRALDWAPLRWVGERSYGIYLWHWPLLLILPPIPAFALTIACASLSYHFIERPVRRLGFRRSLSLLVRPIRQAGVARIVAITTIALLVVTVPATVAAVAVAPAQSSSAEAIERGQAAMKAQRLAEARAAIKEHGMAGVIDSLDGSVGPVTGPPVAPVPEAPPEPPNGKRIFAVGDSVMLASLPELQTTFKGIWVDATVSRGLRAGLGVVGELAEQDQLRPVLVVGLGTNGPIERSDLSELKHIAGLRPIVLVNAHADRWWIGDVNETLASFANARRGVVLADWDAAIGRHPELLAGDGIHPGASGGEIYAKTVLEALKELDTPAERIGDAE